MSANEANETYPALFRDEKGLALRKEDMILRADFSALLKRVAPGKLKQELLVKAAKTKQTDSPLRAIDATAGFGEDAFLLAAAGFHVDLYERDSVIAQLLEDALVRGLAQEETATICQRMTLHKQDSITAFPQLDYAPDVILLDPMFPARTKSSSVKKKFQLLHHLEKPCEDEEELLAAALLAHARKTIIKRPVKGPYLANRKPDYSISGKAIRYDVIVQAR